MRSLTVAGLGLGIALTVRSLVAAPLVEGEAEGDLTAIVDEALAGSADLEPQVLYDRALLAGGTIEELISELESRSEGGVDAALATRLAAAIHERHGDLADALAAYESLLDDAPEGAEPDAELLLSRARVLDALGRSDEALEAYGAAVEAVDDADVEIRVRLRMALLAMDGDEEAADALAAFARAEGRDVGMRNRAAVVLALLDRHADAIELFQVDDNAEGSAPFRQHVRLAEWALRADETERAQTEAWTAVQVATLNRDRHYALAVLVEAHRADDTLDALLERFAAAPEIGELARTTWIDLLRETGRVDEAVELFRSSGEGELSVEMRRELLEMYLEGGHDDVMVETYEQLIAEEPRVLEWREGLSRYYLERGDEPAARALWEPFVEGAGDGALLWGARVLGELGQDALAIRCIDRAVAADEDAHASLLYLFQLHRDRGRLDEAVAALDRLDALAPADAPARLDLSEAFEQVGMLERAVEVLEGVREARGGRSGEDTEMRLAWLYSEVGDEERAMEAWYELWRRIDSVPRRRYVEDRLMTVAARLGRLADIAIDLEEKLEAGTADDRDSGLLVRLYSKVNDAVSATEVIEEFLKSSGASEVETLQEKARVYISCTDYHNYEKTVAQLMEVDPDGRPDYLRQLALSMLERGKPQQAREVLAELEALEPGADSSEFEAGVLALSGLRAEAVEAYRAGIARHPERIESYLLMASLMRQTGDTRRAIGMFQHLAETADKDDLFTIAIDGLLNMEAPPPVMEWALRVTLERLAERHDKMYLYQLIADLEEQTDDRPGQLTALESSLPIAGERRPSVLRELMDLSRAGGDIFSGRSWAGDPERHLVYGRRLISLEEIVPPQVYLDLGEAFLEADDVASASKTFRLASDMPDYDSFLRDSAVLFEQHGHTDEALRTYERVLVGAQSDAGLLAKVGELHERGGDDSVALALYERAVRLLLSRRALTSARAAEEESDDPFRFYLARNIDDFDQHFARCRTGVLAAASDEDLARIAEAQRAATLEDLALVRDAVAAAGEDARLRNHPRLLRRSEFHRRVAIASGHVERADELDLALLAAFDADEGLLEELCRERLRWGLIASARRLVEQSGRPREEWAGLAFLVGEESDASAGMIPFDEVRRQFLPLLVAGRDEDASILMQRADLASLEASELDEMGAMFAAAQYLGDPDLLLYVGREWGRLMLEHGRNSYEAEPIWQRCGAALDPERRRTLFEYYVQAVLADTEANSDFITLLPALQKGLDEPLLDEEQLLDLLDAWSVNGGYGFGLAPVLALLPDSARTGALRTVMPKIQETQRAYTLIGIVTAMEGPVGEELEEFLVGAFADSLEESDDILQYYIDQLFETSVQPRLVLRMADAILEGSPNDLPARFLRANMLSECGRDDEAAEALKSAYIAWLDADPTDYQIRRARDHAMEEFLPARLDVFLAALDERAEALGRSGELAMQRLDLIAEARDEKDIQEELEAAVEEFPDHVPLLRRLQRLHNGKGDTFAALEVLERIFEATEDDAARAGVGQEIAVIWERLRHPVRALEIREQMDSEGIEQEQAPLDSLAALRMSGASFVIVNGVVMDPSDTGDAATIQGVKEALDSGDEPAARLEFRRLWRNFTVGEVDPRLAGMVIYSGVQGGPAGPTLPWPEDEEEAVEEDGAEPEEPAARPRGGLEGWRDFVDVKQPDEQRNAYAVLAAEHAFGRDEVRRLLRTREARALDGASDEIEGVLAGLRAAGTDEEVLEELLAVVREGRAGKIEYALLLTLLDENPEIVVDDARAVLADLVRTLSPSDGMGLLRLARVHARLGDDEQATHLLRWCATQTTAVSRFFVFGGSGSTLSPNLLLAETKEMLEGEQRAEVIEAILRFANPGDDPWAREQYELLVLDTWEEMFGPEVALERCRRICEEVTDLGTGLRRETALRAAWLWARGGDLDRAVRSLEIGLCKLDPALVPIEQRPWGRAEYPGYLGHDDVRRLFPTADDESVAGWEGYADWLAAASAALATWLEEDRTNAWPISDGLCVAALRLHEVGDTERAHVVFDSLVDLELSASKQLWLADVDRRIGDGARADEIEARLFDERRLHVERVPEVVARALESEGPERALELGAFAAEGTGHPALLATLVEAAEAAGDADAAERYRAAIAERDAAEEELERRREAERAEKDGES